MVRKLAASVTVGWLVTAACGDDTTSVDPNASGSGGTEVGTPGQQAAANVGTGAAASTSGGVPVGSAGQGSPGSTGGGGQQPSPTGGAATQSGGQGGATLVPVPTGGNGTGAESAGGAQSTGGAEATGGEQSAGGAQATGGKQSTGGAEGTGGAQGGNEDILDVLSQLSMYWEDDTTEAASWLVGDGDFPLQRIAWAMEAAGTTQFPVFTMYTYIQGTGPHGSDYAAWVQSVADTIESYPGYAVVVLEPDTFAMPSSDQDHRVLDEAIGILKDRTTRTAVFLDIGHSAWIQAESVISQSTSYTNFDRLDGYASNTSNFRPTADEAAYAAQLYNTTGKPTIIDTSRNGLADSAGIVPDTVHNPPDDQWDVGASFAWHPDDPAVFFNYHNKPWNESD